MTDSQMLRDWVTRKGFKLKAIAAQLGVTPYALQRKIDNQSEFKASEIRFFVDCFGMTTQERDKIFFGAE